MRDAAVVQDGPFERKRLAGWQTAFFLRLLFELAAIAFLLELRHDRSYAIVLPNAYSNSSIAESPATKAQLWPYAMLFV